MPTQKPDQEHINLYLPRDLMAEVRLLIRAHEEVTGFKLSISATLRGIIADGLKARKIKKNEYAQTHPGGREFRS